MSETKDRFLNFEFSPAWTEVEEKKPLRKSLYELIEEKENISKTLEEIELKKERLANMLKFHQMDFS
jgi:hypothetical protein